MIWPHFINIGFFLPPNSISSPAVTIAYFPEAAMTQTGEWTPRWSPTAHGTARRGCSEQGMGSSR